MTKEQLYNKIMESINAQIKNALFESALGDFGKVIETNLDGEQLKGDIFISYEGEKWSDIKDLVWELDNIVLRKPITFNDNSITMPDNFGDSITFWLKRMSRAEVINNRLVMWWKSKEMIIISNKVPSDLAKSLRKLLDNKLLTECDCGGGDCAMPVGAVYNTPMNTIGIGDPVPAGFDSLGSGDKFEPFGFIATKKGNYGMKPAVKRRSKKKKK